MGIYERALRLDSEGEDASEIRLQLTRMAIELEQFSAAKLHAEMLDRQASPEDGEPKFLLGRCEEGTGQYRKAADLYAEAIKREPTLVEAYPRLANLLRENLNQADQADAIMDAREEKGGLIAANGTSADAYLARASYRDRYGIEGSATDVAKALELAPDDADVLLAAAESARAAAEAARAAADSANRAGDTARAKVELERTNREIERAIGHLKHGAEKHPKNAAMYSGLADLEMTAGRFDEARKWLETGIKELPEDGSLRWTLVDVLAQAGEVEKATQEIEMLKEAGVDRELIDYLEGRVRMAQRKWGEAAKSLEKAQVSLAARSETRALAKRTLLLLGECYNRLGNVDQAYVAYRSAVGITLTPEPFWIWAAARLGLASSLVELNQIDEALKEYRVVLPKQPEVGVIMARLQIYRNLNKTSSEQDWKQVEQILVAAEQTAPDSAEVTALQAEVLAAQGKLGDAHALLTKAIESRPDQVELRIALSNLCIREGKPEEALAVLDEAREKLGDRIELRVAHAGYWTRRGGDAALSELEQLGRNVDQFTPDERARLQRVLATGFLSLGEIAKAEVLWRQLAKERPDDLNAKIILFDLAQRTITEAEDKGDASGVAQGQKQATEALKDIQRVEGPGGPLGNYGEASLLIRRFQKDPNDQQAADKARQLLAQAAARRPSWSRVPLAQARIAELSGNTNVAIQNYQRAILTQGNREAEAIRRLIALLFQRQRFAEADLVFKKLHEEQIPLSGGLQQMAAQIAYQNAESPQDFQSALKEAEKTVSDQSENPDELVWLGQLRWKAGEDAEPVFRRAVTLGPRIRRPGWSWSPTWPGRIRRTRRSRRSKRPSRRCPRIKRPWSCAVLRNRR